MKRRKTRGQSLIEYLILVAIIAVGSIGIVTVLGNTLRAKVENAAKKLAGEPEDSDARDFTRDAKGKVRRDIGNFNH